MDGESGPQDRVEAATDDRAECSAERKAERAATAPRAQGTAAGPGLTGSVAGVQSEQYLNLLFHQALDAMIMLDEHGAVTHWNPQAEVLFGWTQEEARGQSLASLIIPEPYRREHELGLKRFLSTGQGPVLNQRLELSALRRDGQTFPVELTVTAAQLGGRFTFSGFVRDISGRKRYEAQLARRALEAELLHRASVLAGEANSFTEALQGCVDIVCKLTGWPVGHVYLPDEANERLVPTSIWHLAADFPGEFREVTEHTYLPRGVGLPGRIWQSGRPEWIGNVSRDHNFPRAAVCADVGLQSGFGFPIHVENRVVAVLEFFGRDQMGADPDLLTIIRSVGNQMGRVIERKQAEEERARLAAIVHSSHDAIIGMTLDGIITNWNHGAQRMFGYTAEELVGRSIDRLSPHDRAEESSGHREQLKRGEVIESFETVRLSKDGRQLDVLLSISPLVDAAGQIIGASTIARNITDRRRTERTLAEQARLASFRADVSSSLARPDDLRTLLQQVCEILVDRLDVAFARVWTVNSTEKVLELQASAGIYTHLDGPHGRIPVGEFKIGRIAQNRRPHLTNDVSHDPHISNPEWARREGMVAFAGYPLAIEDRTLGVLAMFARRALDDSVLRDLEGIAHVISQCIDRKRAEESVRLVNRDLREKNEEMEQFVYTVSHDLKSPLVTISGFIGLLEDELGEGRSEKVKHCLHRIQRSADRMSDLIDHLLELSRIGRVQGTVTPVDVSGLVKEIAAGLQTQASNAEATIEVVEHMPVLLADRSRLAQVFENLLVNAIKYGCPQPGGRIRVKSSITSDSLRYHVQDDGPGIPEDYHEKVFGLFQRLDTRLEGSGVGLTIVAKIMKIHGGRVEIESEVGRGTTFHLIFPLSALVPQQVT